MIISFSGIPPGYIHFQNDVNSQPKRCPTHDQQSLLQIRAVLNATYPHAGEGEVILGAHQPDSPHPRFPSPSACARSHTREKGREYEAPIDWGRAIHRVCALSNNGISLGGHESTYSTKRIRFNSSQQSRPNGSATVLIYHGPRACREAVLLVLSLSKGVPGCPVRPEPVEGLKGTCH